MALATTNYKLYYDNNMSGSKITVDKVINCRFLKINDEWNDENKSIINNKTYLYFIQKFVIIVK